MRSEQTTLGVGLLACIGLLGCAASPAELMAKGSLPEAPPQDRLSSTSPLGPTAFRSYSFDYGALPTLEPMMVEEDASSAAFEIVKAMPGYSLHMDGDLVAEVQIGNYRVFRGTDGSKAKESSLAPGAEAVCDHQGPTVSATWQGYVDSDRTKTEITYVCFEGRFDAHACRAKAERAWRVRAKAIVPGAIFAFRAAEGVCSPASKLIVGHQETMELVGPKAIWIGSSAPQSVRPGDLQGSFSRVLIPVSRGGSSSAVLDVRRGDLGRGVDPRDAATSAEILSYSFDVVWPAAEPAPSGTAFASAIRGDEKKVTAPDDRGYQYEFASE